METTIIFAVLCNRSRFQLILRGCMNAFDFVAFWSDWAICSASPTLHTRSVWVQNLTCNLNWDHGKHLPKPDMHTLMFLKKHF